MDDTYNIPIPLQNIGCQDLLGEDKCSHCGWLRKKRTVTLFSWPHVYVLLHEGCLYYFKHEKAKAPSGKFSLYGYNSVFRAGEVSSKEATWVFKIVHSHSEFRTYYFSASSEQEMKTWMMKVKQEMLMANGKTVPGRKPHKDEKPEDDNKFYQEVETNIYDDSAKFMVTQEYSKQYSVKRETEDSDDDDIDTAKDTTRIDNRPPLPLPSRAAESPELNRRAPIPPPRPTGSSSLPPKPAFKAPRPPDVDSLPTEPRTHKVMREQHSGNLSPSSSPKFGHQRILMDQLNSKLNEHKRKPDPSIQTLDVHKRRGSYEKTDGPGATSPFQQRKHLPVIPVTDDAGSSTGSDFSDDVSGDEYWAAIHFEERDKQKANDIIQAIGEEGVYLVRPEGTGEGKVLVVYADDTPKKYRIQQSQDREYFLAREGYKSHRLEELLRFYYEEELPTVHVKLKGPYKLHSKFKELNL